MSGNGNNGKNREFDLDAALDRIEDEFGSGAVAEIGARGTEQIEAIPSGALSLDLALGIGGVPRGRIVEVYGPESSGKTTLTYHVIAEAQRLGGRCVFIDAEHAMDPVYAGARSASTPTRCCSASPTTASRRWRSPTCWSAPARSRWS